MKHETIKLRDELSEYLKTNGTDSFTKLVSNSIDLAGANQGDSIRITRSNFAKKFDSLSKLDLTVR